MKRSILLCVFVSIFPIITHAQHTEFFKSYRLSSTLREKSENICVLQNGQILDVGETSHCSATTSCYNSCALIWFDQYGNMVRNKKIGSHIGFYGVQAVECPDHSLIVQGNISNDLLFMKTDSTGAVTWSKVIDDATNYMSGRDLIRVDTTYFVNGHYGSTDSQIYSFTESGNFRWLKTPVAADQVQLASIVSTGSNTLLGIAALTSTTTYYGAACLLEMDLNGNVLNSKIVTPSYTSYIRMTAFKICKTSDGNFIATFAYSNGIYYMMKLDASLNILWSVNIAANPLFASGYHDAMTADNQGGAWIGSHAQYATQIEFIHISSSGTLLDKNSYKTASGDMIELSGMNYTPDCNLLISGFRRDNLIYYHFLAALGMDGKTTCLDSIYNVTVTPATLSTAPYSITFTTQPVTVNNMTMFQETGVYQEINLCGAVADICPLAVNEIPNEDKISIYPNPFSAATTISFTEMQTNTTIKIIDVTGKEIRTLNFTGTQLTIEKEEMSSGIYFVQITDRNKNVITEKIIIE